MNRWWQRRTLRFTLAMWYAVGGTVLLTLFSATVYLYVTEWVARPLDQDLRRDLGWIEQRLTVTRDGRVLWEGKAISDRSAWPTQNPWFELWDDHGHLIKRMWPFTDNRVEVMPSAPVPGRETISVYNIAQDLRLRVLSVPYDMPGQDPDWMIRVMRVHEPMAGAFRALRWIMLIALPIVIALLVVGGYLITRRWLAPLDEMLAEADRITAENLDRRLPVPNPNDELGRLASVFNVTLDRLARSFSALNRFVADASHELRTPLTTLRSVGEIGLRGGRTNAEYRDIIGSMLEEAQRLETLVQRLLELATAEGGAAAAHRTEVHLADFVNACVEDLAILAETKEQRLSINAAPVTVFTDPVLLRQALQNLVDNAIKYSPRGAAIRIAVQPSDAGGTIVVQDNGPGISSEHRAGLAQRFYRPDRGRDRGAGGFGLGLSLTKAYMALLGGTLHFSPVSPHGSTFTLEFPNLPSRPST